MSFHKELQQAYEEIDEAFEIEYLAAKKRRHAAMAKALSDTMISMIENTSTNILTTIKDDVTDPQVLDEMTHNNLFSMLMDSIKDPMDNPTDMEIDMEPAKDTKVTDSDDSPPDG
jgi:hypothetical protein